MQKANKAQVPHIVFHLEGEAADGEFVHIERENHSFGETATIGQILGRGWALADALTGIRIDHVSAEIGMCDGGDDSERADKD